MTLEKRLNDVESSIKVIAQYVKEQTERIEKELSSARGEALYDPKPEIEELRARLDSVSQQKSKQRFASPDDIVNSGEVDTLKKSLQLLRSELDEFRNDVSPKVQYLDKKTDKLRESVESVSLADIEDMKRHFDRVDKKVHETLAVKEELDDIEETLTKMKAIASRLKDFDAASYRQEFDKHMSQMFGQLKDLEVHDINNLTKHWKEAKEAMEEEAVSRISTEKRLSELETALGQIKNMETSDFKRVNEMLEHIQGIEVEEMKEIAKNIKEAKDALEDESVNRLSVEKRLGSMEAKVNKISEIAEHMENVEGLDIQKLSNRISDIESNMKINTVKLLTQQLNEFAKSVDRRLPNIVSREEYARQIADLNQRMRTVEAPDLSPLGARVERLERKIEEVASMMRQMYDRVPIIVE